MSTETVAPEGREQDLATPEQVSNAAYAWCGQKERETFHADIVYFRNNWRALPGLREFVRAEVARAALKGNDQ